MFTTIIVLERVSCVLFEGVHMLLSLKGNLLLLTTTANIA